MMEKQLNICSICDLVFSSKGAVKRHENSTHKMIKYDCQYCGKQFTKTYSLTIHINSIHKGIKQKCSQCDEEFAQKSSRYRLIMGYLCMAMTD